MNHQFSWKKVITFGVGDTVNLNSSVTLDRMYNGVWPLFSFLFALCVHLVVDYSAIRLPAGCDRGHSVPAQCGGPGST